MRKPSGGEALFMGGLALFAVFIYTLAFYGPVVVSDTTASTEIFESAEIGEVDKDILAVGFEHPANDSSVGEIYVLAPDGSVLDSADIVPHQSRVDLDVAGESGGGITGIGVTNGEYTVVALDRDGSAISEMQVEINVQYRDP